MKNNSGGIDFCEVLTIVFILLKFFKIIKWSWLWVLSPLWIPVIIIFLIFLYDF